MRHVRRWTVTLLPAALLTLLLASGCGGDKKPEGSTGGGTGSGTSSADKGGTTSGAKDLEVAGYTTLSGRVTYNGDKPPTVAMLAPQKDQEHCPMKVPAEGWYTDNSSDKKGVQYTLVFLKAPKGFRMPKAAPELEKPAADVVDMHQPRCQFEPRVVCLHPKQNIKFHNDSKPSIKHDANVTHTRFSRAQTLNPGETTVYEFPAYNSMPLKVTCAQHQGTMSAYVWKMDHPYAVVTDADGKFTLNHVPVTKGEKMVLAVWHEMLPGTQMKDIGPVDLEVGKPATKDVAIPK